MSDDQLRLVGCSWRASLEFEVAVQAFFKWLIHLRAGSFASPVQGFMHITN